MNNTNTTKRKLTSSVLAMIVCIAMLIGTTFAWFTDSASTEVNNIQAGTLDIELQYQNADGMWVNAEGVALDFKKAEGASEGEAILWEPGCTYELPAIRILNKGNLALKYKLTITGINGDAELNNVIDWTVNDGTDNGGTLLSQYTGTMIPGENDNVTTSKVIKGHMQESAGNEYQGKTIDSIAITVVATQLAHEYDSNDNQYDAGAVYPVVDSAELADAITQPGSVIKLSAGTFAMPTASVGEGVTIAGSSKTGSVLQTNQSKITSADVTLKNLTVQGDGSAGTTGTLNISGNNTTIENVDYVGDGGIGIAVSTGNDNTGTVFKDTKITNAFRAIQFWKLSGDSVIDNCILDVNGYTFNVDSVAPGATLTVKDSTLNGWTSYTSGIQLVSFDKCKFGLNVYEYLRPYSNTTLTGCEFTSAGYRLNAGGSADYTITLTNCTKNGTAITAENVISLLIDTDSWNSNATLIVNGVTVTVN